jgi:phospholipid/cholesterol/gamma-HCH transport system permease protein
MKEMYEIIIIKLQNFFSEVGKIFILLKDTLIWIFRPPLSLRLIFTQMEEIGIRSLPVVLITATFTGMVFAIQSYSGFRRFGAETLIGPAVALSITRELGPALTALMVAGRAGSAIAAELGTMRVTEQIDALYAMASNPIKYLVVPRFLSAIIMLPLLTIVADFCGIFGGYLVSVKLLGSNPHLYLSSSFDILEVSDITNGLLKAAVFGAIIAHIGCYYGFFAKGGAEGVGHATHRAVVISCMFILISNFFLAKILF